ncbi:TIGR04197 family type VII secretion effector [Listeria booriae]|uniref:TIGR04197 family type VII secretion effector n=1 Tax=Listeria booriae TaxID=1552123 RepID=UPI00162ACB59|nr:TIGR04197 family type VII secretion effector [Listeria booriae]MBC2322243.1 TIGR04197 family type VII secretion effector [Listeria booriae]MCD2206751.1 TIGR04197 family type VII secretion effector [Listeria booriae]
MSKKIQLPSGRLSEHAKEIGSSANDISFDLRPNMSYSTSSARQLVQSSMDAGNMIKAMPEAFNKDVQNLKNVEQAFVASEKKMADMWTKALHLDK